MSTKYIVSVSAAIFPPNFGPVSEAYQGAVLAAIQSQVAARNAVAAGNFSQACANWTIQATQNQAYNITPQPKPVAPAGEVAQSVMAQTDDTIETVDASGNKTETTVAIGPVLYAWVTTDGAPVGPPCPDLAPMKTQIHVVTTSNGNVMNVPIGDTTPIGTVIVAPDGSKWQRMETNGPFGPYEYYQKVA